MDNVMVTLLTAQEYHDRGQVFPVDLYFELQATGICPEQLEEMFDEGLTVDDIANSYFLSSERALYE